MNETSVFVWEMTGMTTNQQLSVNDVCQSRFSNPVSVRSVKCKVELKLIKS